MAQQGRKSIRFGSSWSTQFRLTQALGRGLASLMPVDATVVLTGSSPMANLAGGEIDVCFLKSVNNVHRYTGVGLFAGDRQAQMQFLATVDHVAENLIDGVRMGSGPACHGFA